MTHSECLKFWERSFTVEERDSGRWRHLAAVSEFRGVKVYYKSLLISNSGVCLSPGPSIYHCGGKKRKTPSRWVNPVDWLCSGGSKQSLGWDMGCCHPNSGRSQREVVMPGAAWNSQGLRPLALASRALTQWPDSMTCRTKKNQIKSTNSPAFVLCDSLSRFVGMCPCSSNVNFWHTPSSTSQMLICISPKAFHRLAQTSYREEGNKEVEPFSKHLVSDPHVFLMVL